ncbi:hypothetical protein BFL35_12580 [Clavibacter michiganensis]|nr:hypothetical protein BFL35_12580 [Clavibacter michiganensis]
MHGDRRAIDMMQVFVSWSGKQAQEVAKALREHLPPMLDQRVEFFVSAEDIAKGARGISIIAAQLETAQFGLVVVTPQNVDAPWINFEAGALGKSLIEGKVAPILIGMTDAEVKGPIKQFQNTVATSKTDMYRLIESINSELPDPFSTRSLKTLFDGSWTDLIKAVEDATAEHAEAEVTQRLERADADVLSEVLTTVRALQRDIDRLSAPQVKPYEGLQFGPATIASTSQQARRAPRSNVPMYSDEAAPVFPLNQETLVFDVKRHTQVAWLDGRLVLPIGSKIELFDPATSTHGTAVVVGVRLLNGTSKVPNQVCLDCEVEARWWEPVEERHRKEDAGQA